MSDQDRLVFVATSDLAGLVRGKSFPQSEWDKRLSRGVGWTPTNVQITCFDTIAESPFGSFGDLALVPDPDTRFTLVDDDDVFDFALGDIRSLEGEPWAFCTRSLARRAVDELRELCGAVPVAAFEHEFEIAEEHPRLGDAYGLKGFRDARPWAEALMAALRQTSCRPDSFMKEYGPSKYEITNKPAQGIAAADNAVILRVLTHDVLRRFGVMPSFSPIVDPEGVGNGVHVHLSFVDENGAPLTYDAGDPHGMSALTKQFVGGVLKYLDQILALLAPSEISYLRLTPHRWSAAFNNLGYRDREASVRICPLFTQDGEAAARQFNFEVRALDAAASPYLAFAAILFAGAQGIRDRVDPPVPTEEDLSLLSPDELAGKGFRRLPENLNDALAAFGASEAVRSWFGSDFVDVYVAHKRSEIDHVSDLDWAARCERYRSVY